MYFQLKDGTVETFVENDPYIPMNVRFGGEDFEVDRMGIYGPDGDLLEIAASLETREMRELTLVHCGCFRIVEHGVEAPESESGIISIDMPGHVDAECFILEVYSDGMRCKLADSGASEYLRSGNVVLGLSEGGKSIAEIIVFGLTANEIGSAVSTLEYCKSQRNAVLYMDGRMGDLSEN